MSYTGPNAVNTAVNSWGNSEPVTYSLSLFVLDVNLVRMICLKYVIQ